MNGLVRLKVDWIYGNTESGNLRWSNKDYITLKNKVAKAVREKKVFGYPNTDGFLPEVFQKYPITTKQVAIIGSATPIYEAYIEYFGGRPLTIEYREIEHDIPNLITYTFDKAVGEINAGRLQVDCAFCYSSLEHSGLGRYGDNLDPDGDLYTMNVIKKIVKPGGLLYLQIPIGQDVLLWNNCRIYGPFRLLYLLEGWKLRDVFGFEPRLFGQHWESLNEIILVLENTDPGNSQQKLFTKEIISMFQGLNGELSTWHRKIKELSANFNVKDCWKSPPPKISLMKRIGIIISTLIKKIFNF